MADGIVQVPPDSTGKKIDVASIDVGAVTVYRQRMVIGDNSASAQFATVTGGALLVLQSGAINISAMPAIVVSGAVSLAAGTANIGTINNISAAVTVTLPANIGTLNNISAAVVLAAGTANIGAVSNAAGTALMGAVSLAAGTANIGFINNISATVNTVIGAGTALMGAVSIAAGTANIGFINNISATVIVAGVVSLGAGTALIGAVSLAAGTANIGTINNISAAVTVTLPANIGVVNNISATVIVAGEISNGSSLSTTNKPILMGGNDSAGGAGGVMRTFLCDTSGRQIVNINSGVVSIAAGTSNIGIINNISATVIVAGIVSLGAGTALIGAVSLAAGTANIGFINNISAPVVLAAGTALVGAVSLAAGTANIGFINGISATISTVIAAGTALMGAVSLAAGTANIGFINNISATVNTVVGAGTANIGGVSLVAGTALIGAVSLAAGTANIGFIDKISATVAVNIVACSAGVSIISNLRTDGSVKMDDSANQSLRVSIINYSATGVVITQAGATAVPTASHGPICLTVSTSVGIAMVAAPGAGLHVYITSIAGTNGSGTLTRADVFAASLTTSCVCTMYMAASGGGFVQQYDPPIKILSNTGVTARVKPNVSQAIFNINFYVGA